MSKEDKEFYYRLAQLMMASSETPVEEEHTKALADALTGGVGVLFIYDDGSAEAIPQEDFYGQHTDTFATEPAADGLAELRVWIWDQIDRLHRGAASLPAYDHVLNKLDEITQRAPAAREPYAADFLTRLREANAARNEEYRAKTAGQPLPLLFRATEFAGEVGELCNVIKKMERERLGWGGKRATMDDLREEFGGVLATLDLLAMELSIDLADVTAREFNKVTNRLGLTVTLPIPNK